MLKKSLLNKDSPKVTYFYTDFQIMDEMKISPSEFDSLHRYDIAFLRYGLMLKGYYEDERIRKDEEKRKQQQLRMQ